MELLSDALHFQIPVTLTLTPDLDIKKACPGHIAFILSSRTDKFGMWINLRIAECCVTLALTSDRDIRKTLLEHISYTLSFRIATLGV